MGIVLQNLPLLQDHKDNIALAKLDASNKDIQLQAAHHDVIKV